MTPAQMLQWLTQARDGGWLRSLDLALANFIFEADPTAPASLLLAAALTANMEGRGHSGLPVQALAEDSADVLSWPMEAVHDLHTALECWPRSQQALHEAWHGHASIELGPVNDSGVSPLVWSGELLYLRRYWRYESRVAAQVRARVVRQAEASHADGIDTVAARALLDQLYGPHAPGADPAWQKIACALALRHRLTIITGGPGTGKTYTAARLLVLLQHLHQGPQALRVAQAAPTGKAAARLRQSIGGALHDMHARLQPSEPLESWAAQLGPARTLHSLLGTRPGTRRFRHDAANPLDVDLLFVDEASMVHLEMMAQLLDALPAAARLVLLGDKDQLSSVEAGAVFADLCQGAEQGAERASAGRYNAETTAWIRELTGHELPPSESGNGSALAQQTAALRKSQRFGGPIGQLALAINQGDAAAALDALRKDEAGPVSMVTAREAAAVVPLALRGREGAAGGYATYLDQLAQRPASATTDHEAFGAWARNVIRAFDGFRVLCAVREGAWGVSGLNNAIERALAKAGQLSGRGEWYEGRPVMVTRNDATLRVFNGDIGIVLRSPSKEAVLLCYFLDGDELRSVPVGRLADVETAFAMTVHKSQGSEFGHVVLVLPEDDAPVLTRELLYTGVTRAREAFTLVCRQPGLLATATKRLTQRVSGLRGRLVD